MNELKLGTRRKHLIQGLFPIWAQFSQFRPQIYYDYDLLMKIVGRYQFNASLLLNNEWFFVR